MTAAVHAGVRFMTDATLIKADDSGFSDLDVTATWVPPDAEEYGTPIPAPERTYLWIDTDDNRVLLPNLKDTDIMRAWQLRQGAPVVAAHFDRLTIHASAVAAEGSVLALCGEAGAGKSTLAWALVKAGATPISDDLLPIRFDTGPYVPTKEGPMPLAATFFLSRDAGTLTTESIDAAAALKAHIANGFGEHRESETWAFQFDAYHRLATGASHYDLTIPDDRSRIDDVVRSLLAQTSDAVTA